MKWKRIGLSGVALSGFGVLIAIYLAFQLSPWPMVLLIRHAFKQGTIAQHKALARHLPAGMVELRDVRYGEGAHALLDEYFPSSTAPAQVLPTIVWVHGGAFVYGDKSDVDDYLKILASFGYTTVSVDYTIAPGAQYPTPVREVNEALSFLVRNHAQYHIDPSNLFLAGDSAGAQIAAQLAAIVSDEAYARDVGIVPSISRAQLRGVILFCGIFDAGSLNLTGKFGSVLRTVIWSYFGVKDATGDPRLSQFSVSRHLTSQFPPAFISAGNTDPLERQSRLMDAALRAQGVAVDSLFFPIDYQPALAHEYQFALDDAAGREALERVHAFVARYAVAQ